MNKKEELVRFSGTLPKDLAKEFKDQAKKEQRSFNTVFNIAIRYYLSQIKTGKKIDE
jgi:metal-responsive CopG/Arc/MetJ family transcriptional regulator